MAQRRKRNERLERVVGELLAEYLTSLYPGAPEAAQVVAVVSGATAEKAGLLVTILSFGFKHGIPVDFKKRQGGAPYSMDANLLHISYEGRALEDPARMLLDL